MKQLSLMVDLNRCIGCRTCIVACRNFHEIIDHASAMPNELPHYLRVESRTRGVYPDLSSETWVVPCQHCKDPQCLVSCPQGAISKDVQTGVVRIDKETCDGCGAVRGTASASKQHISPCKASCPAHMNVQGYVRLVAKGRFTEALKVMKEDNPFPAVCGRVCAHPCESQCNRGSIDEPVAINAIKRFVADLDLDVKTRYVPEIKSKRQERVAVIGSGPAGLSCAYFLARDGYPVTVFEKSSFPGGMLTSGIPAYRLPENVIDAEIQVIRDMGVEIKTDVELGKDVAIDQLRKDGYKAFFVGIGAQECKSLGIEGEQLAGIYSGIDFLMKSNMGETTPLGKRVAVIGGGNTAFDAVRTARRMGADEAFLLYRRSMNEIPANADETTETLEEGIPLNILTQPVRFIGDKGRVSGIECVKMELKGVDVTGRAQPVAIPGSELIIAVDAVITALGQETDWACLTPECACRLTEWGTMHVDPVTFQSHDPDIFAGGDAVTGPQTVIGAIAAGKEAAISIDRFIRKVDLKEGRGKPITLADEFPRDGVPPVNRVPVQSLKPQERVSNFDEVQLSLTEKEAMEEAGRCLGCGCACIQACPYGVIQFDPKQSISHKCNLCFDRIHVGEIPVCAEVCMTDAITFGEYDLVRQRAVDAGKQVMEDRSKESILYVKNGAKDR